MKKAFLLIAIFFITQNVFSQNPNSYFKRQEKQERTIKRAYKRNQITETEYRKLMNEQITIKRYLKSADADGYWSPSEKKHADGKLIRAANRMKRYKTNWEE